MARWLRHLLAIAILPGTVALLVPVWIARRHGAALAPGGSAGEVALQLVGLALFAVGLLLFLASLRRFASEGEGTLAPWDPPRVLVLRGPYRFVRNPMISGVVFILFGEALVLLSPPHGAWAAGFLLLNLLYIPLIEEPQLEARFGESYREYRRHVRRFLPRLGPWLPGAPPRTPAASRALALDLLPGLFAVARLDPGLGLPPWIHSSPFVSVTRSAAELSVVCSESALPPSVPARRGLRCLGVRGPLDFSEVGVLESLARPLAQAGISIFAISSYETDHLLVSHESLEAAVRALSGAGFTVHGLGA